MRVAVLDDYFNIALSVADWSPLDGRAQVKVFSEHLGDETDVIAALKEFEVIVGMRERTPCPEHERPKVHGNTSRPYSPWHATCNM